jgi:phage shock protein C
MSIADEIKRLHELNQSGALTDEEFAQMKAKLLASFNSSQNSSGFSPPGQNSASSMTQLNQLRRSKTDQWLGGVCGGLGKSTGMESWVWRLFFVLSVVCFGFGFLVYLLAWIFIPEEA